MDRLKSILLTLRFQFLLRILTSSALIVLLLFTSTVHAQSISQDDLDSIARNSVFFKAGIPCSTTSGPLLVGSDNITQIYNALLNKPVHGKPLQDFQVAGIMGNMYPESRYYPQQLQGTGFGQITTAIQAINNSLGWGLVQWTPAGKMIKTFLKPGTDPNGPLTDSDFTQDPNAISVQIDFLVSQLTGTGLDGDAGQQLVDSTDVVGAELAFETGFERHKGTPQADRLVEAQRILDLVHAGQLSGSTTSSAAAAASGGTKPVVVLDPGHGAPKIDRVDQATGLHDGDYENEPEMKDVYAVALMVQSKLQADGYTVVLTKPDETTSVFLRDRANVANTNNAAIAVSIHDQAGSPDGLAFSDFREIYYQDVGLYRGSDAEHNKTTFTNADVAAKSKQYADIFKTERQAAEGYSNIKETAGHSFDNRPGIEPGNIPLVELFSNVPWVYNEVGGNSAGQIGLNGSDEQKYATGIINGVEKSVPTTGANVGGGCTSSNPAGLSNTILAYAWPDYHASPYLDRKPEYAAAVTAAQAKGQYVGGLSHPGVDCGGFVTRAMIDSGFEPNYNYGGQLSAGASNVGSGQKPWLDANWQLIGQVNSSGQLQPGDVAIYKDLSHTFMFVGQIAGFNSNTASSSLGNGSTTGRAPMAGRDDVTADNLIWYRKK